MVLAVGMVVLCIVVCSLGVLDLGGLFVHSAVLVVLLVYMLFLCIVSFLLLICQRITNRLCGVWVCLFV